ncbi:MAG TPA: peptidyl-prolyl cis-trans isomerase [Terriglobales bacterium]|nr:peptidyl-prolyl cis-trans isomerase [Terriglobales bacterium]
MIRFLQTPGPLKKVILGGILLVICAAMVITLVPGGLGTTFGFGGPGQGVLATVAGEDVTLQEVNRATDQMVRQQSRNGRDASMLRPFFVRQAAEQLINEKAILAEAHRLGLRASDGEVRDEIQHGRYAEAFFPGGKFVGQDEYEARLQNAGLTTGQFEQSVKDEILFDKLRDMISGGVTVTDAEVRKEFARENTKVKLEYAVLDHDAVLKELHPTDAELKAYYEQHKASYNNSIPEKRKLSYVVIDTNRLQADVQITPQEIQSYYDQHSDDYRVPEQVNVRHILIKTPPPGPDGKVDQKGVDAARKKAEDVLKQVKAGGDFAALAKKYSDDPGSASKGGVIGWIDRSASLVPEFMTAAFSLPKGGTSDLVQSSYGFHIIHVDDKQPAHMKTLDEVKAQIEPILRQNKLAGIAENQANALLTQARADGLEKAAAAKGLQVITTGFVSRNDVLPGIGSAPHLMDAVFSEPEKAPPDEAQLPEGYAVFDVLAIQPPSTPTLDEIRGRVESEFRNERGAALLTQKTQELSDRAKAEHDLKKAAKELGATVKTSDFVTLDGQVPDIGSMSGSASVAFGMNPGEISGPIAGGGNGVVFTVVDRQEPPDSLFQAKKDDIRDTLLQTRRNELFNLFVSNLRAEMEKSGKIKINTQEMNNLMRAPGGEQGE